MTAIEPPERRVGPHPLGKERIDWLAEFESSWKPPVLLRKHHKSAIKNYYSLKQGRDGSRALCCFCNVEFGVLQLQIHHDDHDRTNNQLSNVMPACEPCNNEERATWLAASYAARCAVSTQLKKENMTDSETIQKAMQERLLKEAPTTFQKSKEYKHKTLVYLLQHVKDTQVFDNVVADIEAITACSHSKAVEYLNGFSLSAFAPFRQWFTEHGQFIAPREGWDAAKYGNDEYRAAAQKVGQ